MKLTDKQQMVFDGLNVKAKFGLIENSSRIHLQNELGLNAVSFGLVIKALVDKALISVEKNGAISMLESGDIKPVEKEKPIKTIYDDNKFEKVKIFEAKPTSKNVADGFFSYIPEDFNQNMFFELKQVGANFNPSKYSFFSKNSDTIEKMEEIIKFYQEPNDNLTKSQRTLRDNIISKHNLDMECKKVGGKMFFLNTWGIASLKDVVKDIINSGRKSVSIIGNRVVVDIDNND